MSLGDLAQRRPAERPRVGDGGGTGEPRSSALRPAPRRWAAFLSLSLLYFLVSAGTFSSLGVALPAMVSELKWTWTGAGLGYTLLGLACGLSSFAPAMAIRRLGVGPSLGLGVILLVVGFASLALTRSLELYLGAEILIGIGFSLTTTIPGVHVLAGLFERRSTAVGAYLTIGGLGQVAGPLFYVAIQGAHQGWRPYWWAFSVAAAVIGALASVAASGRSAAPSERKMDSPPEQVGPGQFIEGLQDWTVRRALGTIQFYLIVGAYTTYLLVNTTAHGFAVEHLRERGVSSGLAAGMLSLQALVGACISVVGGVLGERISAKALMLVALTSLAVGMTALAAARGLELMGVYALGVGIGYGLSYLAATMLLLNYFGRAPNLELYSMMSLISTSAAIGPAFGGWARDTLGSFSGVFLLCAMATVVMLVGTAFMQPPKMVAGGQVA